MRQIKDFLTWAWVGSTIINDWNASALLSSQQTNLKEILLGMPDHEEYKQMLTDLIQKQMVVLGPNIALDKARKVFGMKVSDDGTVMDLQGDPQLILKGVANEYMQLSGQIAQMTLNTLVEKYPSLRTL